MTPILRADDHTAWLLTSVVWVSNSGPPDTWRPQLPSRVASCAAIRARKHSAPSANFSQGTPPSRMLIGAVYAASRGSPATGARRSPQAMKSTTSKVAAPATISSGANPATLAGTGAAKARATSAASDSTEPVSASESPVGSQPPHASAPAHRWCSQPATTRICSSRTTSAGSRVARSSAPVAATTRAAPARGTM